MSDDLPKRYTESERLRQIEQKVSQLSVGGGASEVTVLEDENGVLRYEAGLLPDGNYGVQVYDQDGLPLAGGGGPNNAAQLPFTPVGNLQANNVQDALEELDAEKAAAGSTGGGTPTAAGVTFTPTGKIAASNVQTALAELDTEKVGRSDTVEVLWESDDWDRFSGPVVMTYDAGATYSLSVVSDAVSPPGFTVTGSRGSESAVRRGRISRSGSATTGGNTRHLYLLDETAEFVDCEVQVSFYGHSHPTDPTRPGQMGLVVRQKTATSGTYSGRPTGYVVWHDIIYNLDAWINTAVWSTSGSGTGVGLVQVAGTATEELPGLNYTVGASQYSRTGTTLTLSIPGEHRIQAGDVIDLTGSTIDALNMPVTSLFGPNLVICTHPVSGTTTGGACTVRCRRRTMPSFIKVRLEGNVIRGKSWREGTGEPDWGDPRYSWRWEDTGNTGPTGAGKVGLFAGHLIGGTICDFGSIKVTAL